MVVALGQSGEHYVEIKHVVGCEGKTGGAWRSLSLENRRTVVGLESVESGGVTWKEADVKSGRIWDLTDADDQARSWTVRHKGTHGLRGYARTA